MRFFAVLSCIIASLGLIGLVAYVIEKRNKEIGIRKVLGASIYQVLAILTGEFGKLLLISFLLSTGLSWYFMTKWKADFADQISISPLNFVWAGVFMLVLVVLTLSLQTLKAARANPIKFLRDE